jgi:hypothetical protein
MAKKLQHRPSYLVIAHYVVVSWYPNVETPKYTIGLIRTQRNVTVGGKEKPNGTGTGKIASQSNGKK